MSTMMLKKYNTVPHSPPKSTIVPSSPSQSTDKECEEIDEDPNWLYITLNSEHNLLQVRCAAPVIVAKLNKSHHILH